MLQKLMQTCQLNSIYLPSVVWHQPCVMCCGRDSAATQPLHRGELASPACLSLAEAAEARRRSRDTGLEAALFHWASIHYTAQTGYSSWRSQKPKRPASAYACSSLW